MFDSRSDKLSLRQRYSGASVATVIACAVPSVHADMQFHQFVISDMEPFATRVEAADIDGDGDLDIFPASWGDGAVRMYVNDGGSPPGFHEQHLTFAGWDSETDVCIADLNGDTRLDIVITPTDDWFYKLTWLENKGGDPTVFEEHVVQLTGVAAQATIAECADLDKDGDIDIALASGGDMYSDYAWVGWLQNDGEALPSFTQHIVDMHDLGVSDLILEDIDHDGDIDMLAARPQGAGINLYENNSAPTPTFWNHNLTDSDHGGVVGRYISAADVDEDGDTDLITSWTNSSGALYQVQWWENRTVEEYWFVEHVIDDTVPYLGKTAPVDLDEDGDLDVVGIGYFSNTLVWFERTGTETSAFETHVIDDQIDYGSWVEIVDMDMDDDPDILISTYEGDTIAWYRTSGGGSGSQDPPDPPDPVEPPDPTDPPALPTGVVVVDVQASAGGDGLSWEGAFQSLDQALDHARSDSTIDQIWVAQGTYRPDIPAEPSDPRSATFDLVDGVQIIAGFAGDESAVEHRDISLYPAVLSGDLNADDELGGDTSDNVFHVVSAWDIQNPDTRVDGFVIERGAGFGSGIDLRGGGLFNQLSSPTYADCIFRENSATIGGGVYIRLSDGVSFERCVFERNESVVAHGSGGGVRVLDCDPAFVGCRFVENVASKDGGALYLERSDALLLNCDFIENEGRRGGVIFNAFSAPNIISCRFLSNTATMDGSAMYNHAAVESPNGPSRPVVVNSEFSGNHSALRAVVFSRFAEPTLINCTFSLNTAVWTLGTAIYNYQFANTTVQNCILWQNSPSGTGDPYANQVADVAGGISSVEHCVIEGWTPTHGGIGNMGINPSIVDATGLDGVAGTGDDELDLLAGSAAIDAGDVSVLPPDFFDLDQDGDTAEPLPIDFAGLSRITGLTIDIGAHEQ